MKTNNNMKVKDLTKTQLFLITILIIIGIGAFAYTNAISPPIHKECDLQQQMLMIEITSFLERNNRLGVKNHFRGITCETDTLCFISSQQVNTTQELDHNIPEAIRSEDTNDSNIFLLYENDAKLHQSFEGINLPNNQIYKCVEAVNETFNFGVEGLGRNQTLIFKN